MALFDKEGQLTVKDESFNVGELIRNLTYISGSYFAQFLQEIGLSIPRKLRMGILKNLLREPVQQTIEERKTLADEIGYRLTWFSRFTDSQLVNLLEWYKSPSLQHKYLEDFWTVVLPFLVEKGVSELDLYKLFTRAKVDEKAGILPTTKEFNKALNVVMFDDEGEIDGLSQEAFRPVVYKSSTLTELREIGEKFNAAVPKRLKKNEVLDVILKKLNERGELTKDLQNKLESQNILLLERYAKDHDIKVSTELKKEEIIEFILSNAKETKAAYYVPSSSAVYEVNPEDVKEVEPTPTPVFIAPQPTPGESVTVVDTRQQLDQIARQIEKLTEIMSQKTFEVVVNVPPLEQPHITIEAPVAQMNDQASTRVIENPENSLIQELLKDQPNDIDKVTDLLVDDQKKFIKTGPMKRGLQITTGILSILLGLVYAAAVALAYFMPTLLTDYGLPAEYIADPLRMYAAIGLGVLSLLALVAGFRFMSKKASRKEVRVWSVFSLFTGLIIVGILGFITASSVEKAKVKEESEEVKSDIEKLAEVISKKSKSKKGSGSALLTFFGWLSFILLLLIAVVVGLFFIPGSSTWPVIGDFLRFIYGLIPAPTA